MSSLSLPSSVIRQYFHPCLFTTVQNSSCSVKKLHLMSFDPLSSRCCGSLARTQTQQGNTPIIFQALSGGNPQDLVSTSQHEEVGEPTAFRMSQHRDIDR